MGQPCSVQKCCTVKDGHNSFVTGTPDYDMLPPNLTRTRSQVHMIIVAMDYKLTDYPLSASQDAQRVEEFATSSCGIEDVSTLYNEQCTKHAVRSLLRNIGRICGPDDYIIFYYAGHGTDLQSQDTQAFCCVTPDGKIDRHSLLTDDEFSSALLDSTHVDTNVLLLIDSVHSGTIVDVEKDAWYERRAISIHGFRDFDTAKGSLIGGPFTHAMLMAIEKLSADEHYSVGKLYNTTVSENDRLFRRKQLQQDISIQCSPDVGPNEMAWPLIPTVPYEPPLRTAQRMAYATAERVNHQSLRGDGYVTRGIDIDDGVPDELTQWAKNNDIDLEKDYKDEELENSWKSGKKLLNKLGF